jgi:hypothetical protein
MLCGSCAVRCGDFHTVHPLHLKYMWNGVWVAPCIFNPIPVYPHVCLALYLSSPVYQTSLTIQCKQCMRLWHIALRHTWQAGLNYSAWLTAQATCTNFYLTLTIPSYTSYLNTDSATINYCYCPYVTMIHIMYLLHYTAIQKKVNSDVMVENGDDEEHNKKYWFIITI